VRLCVCQAQQKAREQELLEIGGDGDDALSSFDPYSTGVYKGVAVGTAGAATERVVEVPHCMLTCCCGHDDDDDDSVVYLYHSAILD
jgi:hypothetical protein